MDEFAKFKLDEEGAYLDQMLDGKPIWPRREVPGWPAPIRIRPLGRGIEIRCHAEVNAELARLKLDLGIEANKQLAGEEAALRILYEALVTEDSNEKVVKPLAHTFEKFKNHPAITDEAVSFLWREYEDIKRRLSPAVAELPEPVVAELVEQLKKNANGTQMESMPRSWLVTLCRSMAAQLVALTGSKSSTG